MACIIVEEGMGDWTCFLKYSYDLVHYYCTTESCCCVPSPGKSYCSDSLSIADSITLTGPRLSHWFIKIQVVSTDLGQGRSGCMHAFPKQPGPRCLGCNLASWCYASWKGSINWPRAQWKWARCAGRKGGEGSCSCWNSRSGVVCLPSGCRTLKADRAVDNLPQTLQECNPCPRSHIELKVRWGPQRSWEAKQLKELQWNGSLMQWVQQEGVHARSTPGGSWQEIKPCSDVAWPDSGLNHTLLGAWVGRTHTIGTTIQKT